MSTTSLPRVAGCIGFVLPLLWVSPATARQGDAPATSQAVEDAPARELPEDVVEKLGMIEDFSLNIDHPGYFAVLEFVRNSDFDPGDRRGALEVNDWQVFLDRPGAYRGEPVTIEGVVGRNYSWQYKDRERRERYGTVWELDLRHAERGYPISATVFLTGDAGAIGVDSTIRVTGYFVMVQQYPRRDRSLGQKIVLIAKAPSMISRAAPAPPPPAKSEKHWIWAGAAVAAAMLVVWIIVRGSGRKGRPDFHSLSATRQAPMSLADELEDWADKDDDLKA